MDLSLEREVLAAKSCEANFTAVRRVDNWGGGSYDSRKETPMSEIPGRLLVGLHPNGTVRMVFSRSFQDSI